MVMIRKALVYFSHISLVDYSLAQTYKVSTAKITKNFFNSNVNNYK